VKYLQRHTDLDGSSVRQGSGVRSGSRDSPAPLEALANLRGRPGRLRHEGRLFRGCGNRGGLPPYHQDRNSAHASPVGDPRRRPGRSLPWRTGVSPARGDRDPIGPSDRLRR
jgi:hypothetical protein